MVDSVRSVEMEAAEWLDDKVAAQRLVDLSAELVHADNSIEAMKRALAAMQAQRAVVATKRDAMKDAMAARGIADGTRIRVNGGQVRFVPGYTRAPKDGGPVDQYVLPTIRVDLTRTELFPMRTPSTTAGAPSSDVAPVSKAPATQPSSGVRIAK